MITGPTDHRFHIIFLATAISSSLYRIIIATTSLHWHYTTTCTHQAHHHYTHRILLPVCLKTRVAIMSADQTDKACKLNIGRDLGGVQSMSMVTIQLFANCKRAVEYHLTYLMFCIVKESSSVIWPIWYFVQWKSRRVSVNLFGVSLSKQAVKCQRVEESFWLIW